MIIVEKTEGSKIEHEIMGNLLVLDNAIYLNLPIYERDYPVSIDISRNEYGMLTMGLSRSYVAQIDIPEREYELVETDNQDEDGNYISARMPLPFDFNKVTLTLWGE